MLVFGRFSILYPFWKSIKNDRTKERGKKEKKIPEFTELAMSINFSKNVTSYIDCIKKSLYVLFSSNFLFFLVCVLLNENEKHSFNYMHLPGWQGFFCLTFVRERNENKMNKKKKSFLINSANLERHSQSTFIFRRACVYTY